MIKNLLRPLTKCGGFYPEVVITSSLLQGFMCWYVPRNKDTRKAKLDFQNANYKIRVSVDFILLFWGMTDRF